MTPGAGDDDASSYWIDAQTCVSMLERRHESWRKLVCGGYCKKDDASCAGLWYGKDACAKAGGR